MNKQLQRLLSLTLVFMMVFSGFALSFADSQTGNTSSAKLNDPPVIGEDHPEKPGDVLLFKEAKPVEGYVNLWNITVRIEAKDEIKTSDVVLVIDTSGSMDDNNRLVQAKAAAKSFVDILLTGDSADTTRIALVTFDEYGVKIEGFTKEKDALKDAIDDLEAEGGTFTQDGVRKARELLAAVPSGEVADYNNIVLLSDGVPTYSYKIDEPDDYLVDYGPAKETSKLVPESAYQNDRVGDGYNLRYRYNSSEPKKYYNNGNSAIAEAGFAKTDNYNMWCVGLETDFVGDGVLSEMASKNADGQPQFYEATPDQLQTVFDNIAGKIKVAVQNAAVNDPMGGGFNVPLGEVSNISATSGTTATYDETTKTIDWQIGDVNQPLPDDNTIKYAELTYQVEINDDILAVTPTGEEYATNGETKLTYTDINGDTQSGMFPVPMVNPVLVTVEKILKNSLGETVTNDSREFHVKITGEAGQYDKIYDLTAGEKKVLTNIRLKTTYNVVENAVVDGDLADYTVEQSLQEFNIEDATDPDVEIVITNTEKKLGELTIEKKFSNIYSVKRLSRAEAAPIFEFNVIGPGGFNETFKLAVDESKTFTGLPYGDYTVEETDSQGFIPSYYPGETVTLKITEKEKGIKVTNRPKPDDYHLDLEATKQWADGPSDDHTEVTLEVYRNGEKMDPQPSLNLTGSGDLYKYLWQGLLKYDEKGAAYSYTVEEAGVSTAGEIVVNGHTYQVTNEGTQEDGFKITNRYVVPKIEFTGEKEWLGLPTDETAPTIELQLFRNKKPFGDPVKLIAPNTSYTWQDLDKTDAAGEDYVYSIDEVAKPVGFDKDLGDDPAKLTNTYNPEKIDVTGVKEWVDLPLGEMPPQIELQLYQNKKPFGEPQIVAWPDTSYTWEDLPKTDAKGADYQYTVDEVVELEGFTKYVNGLTVTNFYTPDTVAITGNKEWLNLPVGETPPTIELQLLRNDEVLDGSAVQFTASKTSHTWTGLLKKDSNGKDYKYTIDEVTVPTGFSSDVSDDGLTVVNTYNPEKIEITGTKQWKDVPSDQTPPTIELQLLRNNAVVTGSAVELVYPVTSHTWKDLPKTATNGKNYNYTVDEVTVPSGFTKTVSTATDGAIIVTNTYDKPNNGGTPGGGGGTPSGGGGDETDPVPPIVPQPKLDKLNHYAYIQGYPDGNVRPQGNITREEVAAVFFRLLDSEYREQIRYYANDFTDVPSDVWSNKHISTLAYGRILKGYEDGTFRPHSFITRAELAVIASRFDKLEVGAKHNFSDLAGHWAEPYIASAVEKGWVNGYPDGSFKPEQYITRAEFATLVNNVLERHVHKEDILKEARYFPDLEEDEWYYEAMSVATNSYLYKSLPEFYQKWLEIIYPEIEM